jgi:hypothetical protein
LGPRPQQGAPTRAPPQCSIGALLPLTLANVVGADNVVAWHAVVSQLDPGLVPRVSQRRRGHFEPRQVFVVGLLERVDWSTAVVVEGDAICAGAHGVDLVKAADMAIAGDEDHVVRQDRQQLV